MKPFIKHTGVVAYLDRANVDTDMIIPKQFLRKIERTGFGKHLFHELRYLDYEGSRENPDFILNQDPHRDATILLARDNFGCGSSREHAPWSLADYGFRVIIAPSFADIFFNNCVKNGILLVALPSKTIDQLFEEIQADTSHTITADLEKQVVRSEGGVEASFEIHSFARECLLKGLDHIGWTQQFEERIEDFENHMVEERPWLISKDSAA